MDDSPGTWFLQHIPEPVPGLHRRWADAANRLVVDPDGRPRGMRGTSEF